MYKVNDLLEALKVLVEEGQGDRFVAYIDCVNRKRGKGDSVEVTDEPITARQNGVIFNFRLI